MAAIEGPVDLFSEGAFVQAFKSEEKARKFASNPRRKILTPTFQLHDEKNGPIISAGRPKAEPVPELPKLPSINWSFIADMFAFVDDFEQDEPVVLRPSLDRHTMIERMEVAY